jgi:type IV pilus assembly protein PilE
VTLKHPHPFDPRYRRRWQPPANRVRAATRGLGEDGGFSLPEVLVATLIVGILAAVAIPSLLSTTHAAYDVQAKELARNAQGAAESYAVDHSGYAGITTAALAGEDPPLATTASTQHAYLSAATGGTAGSEFSVTATAADGDQLTIARTNGSVARTCYSPQAKTGCEGKERSSW